MFGWVSARLRDRRQRRKAAVALVHRVFEAARQPALYTKGGVADTFTGRFDLSSLHAGLVLRVLRRRPGLERLAQAFADEFFAEIDDSFRRLGVGDAAIARRVRGSAEGFYGRLKAYDDALNAGGIDTLGVALARNLYAAEEPSAECLGVMAEYALRIVGMLNVVERSSWQQGEIEFLCFEGGMDHGA